MRKLFIPILLLLILSCRSVDDWSSEPVLSSQTVESANSFLESYNKYLEQVKERKTDSETPSIEELDEIYETEGKIAVLSQEMANRWFEFYIVLRQDPGFVTAYKGHYYFRKAIDALSYSQKMKSRIVDVTFEGNKALNRVSELEETIMKAIGEYVAYNYSEIDTEELYYEINKLFRIIK